MDVKTLARLVVKMRQAQRNMDLNGYSDVDPITLEEKVDRCCAIILEPKKGIPIEGVVGKGGRVEWLPSHPFTKGE